MEDIKYLKSNIQVYIGLACVILGSLIINIFIRAGYDFDAIVIGREEYIKLLKLSVKDVAIITFIKRLKQIFIVFVLYKIINIDIAYCLITSFLCLICGGMISVQSYYGGVMSVIEILLFVLPHFIFYILIIKNLHQYYKHRNKSKIYILVMISLLFLSGLLCEVFFSRFFLNEFYQYMVLV